jgi:hypothetical protein
VQVVGPKLALGIANRATSPVNFSATFAVK